MSAALKLHGPDAGPCTGVCSSEGVGWAGRSFEVAVCAPHGGDAQRAGMHTVPQPYRRNG